MKKVGDGLGLRILRSTGFGKAKEYREYSASIVEVKWAKSSRHRSVQLFFHSLNLFREWDSYRSPVFAR